MWEADGVILGVDHGIQTVWRGESSKAIWGREIGYEIKQLVLLLYLENTSLPYYF